MIVVVFSLLLGVCTLFLADYLGKHKILPKELSRKIPHIYIGIAVASWPFYVSYETIAVACLVVLAVAILTKKIGLFSNLRDVNRLSWGDLFMPLGVIAITFMEPNKWVFAASMLQMGLADAAAAIVGSTKGKHSFVYMGHKKSIEGSAAFFVISLGITGLLLFVVPSSLESVPAIVVMAFPIVITAVEALAPFGSDNFLIPVVTATVFTYVF